jgi:group I intron endonuclease
MSKKEKAMYSVYIIESKASKKVYIGMTMEYENRIKRHLFDLKGNRHHSQHLQRAWNKYGEENFIFIEALNGLSKEEAIHNEEYLIEKYYDFLYNVSKSSSGGDLISYHPEIDRIKAKHSENGKLRWENKTEEEKEQASLSMMGENNPMYGKTHTPEAREKISNALKGRTMPEAQRQLMSEFQTLKYSDPKEREKASERNRKRYESPEARKVTGEATRKVFAIKRARGDFDKPRILINKRFDFVYGGIQYKGWKEAQDATGLAIKTMRKRMLDESIEDSYYITPPTFTSDEAKQNRSKAMTGVKRTKETKEKMKQSARKSKEADYKIHMPNGDIVCFKNKIDVDEFLIEVHGMKIGTIRDLLKTGEKWKPKKYIHKHLEGLRITKNEL